MESADTGTLSEYMSKRLLSMPVMRSIHILLLWMECICLYLIFINHIME